MGWRTLRSLISGWAGLVRLALFGAFDYGACDWLIWVDNCGSVFEGHLVIFLT